MSGAQLAKFNAGPYSSTHHGYPVRLNDYSWHVAVFVTGEEAEDYAEYRTRMLHKYDTTDVNEYRNEQ